MTRALHSSLILTAFLALVAVPAMAQRSGGEEVTQIQGNTKIDVNAENVNTVATGVGNTAKTNIGTVCGSKTGDTNITVDVKNVENVVGGIGRKGTVNVGTSGNC